MIHEEICTYEVCKLAKEKGFGEMASCYQGYRKDGTLFYFSNMPEGKERVMQTDCLAPTQSLLQRWLREEKGIYIEVYVDWEDSIEYEMIRYSWRVATIYRVGSYDIGGYYKNESEVYFDTYELALEDTLKYALENLV